MRTLRFSTDAGTAFYKDLRTRIDDFFTKEGLHPAGNAKMKFKMALYFSAVVAAYALLFCVEGPIAFVLCYLVMGLCVLLTAFNVSHDAAHGVAVKNKRVNAMLFQASFQLQGNNAYVWGHNHVRSHHLYTNVEGSDIDVLNNPLVRMTRSQSLRWFHRYQHLYVPFLYLFYSLNWFFFRELLMLFGSTSRTISVKMPAGEVVRLLLFKLIYLAYMVAIPALVLPFGTGMVLFAFLLNHFMVSLVFTAVLGVAHLSDHVAHPEPDAEGVLPMSWPTLQLSTSVDYNVSSAFFNWTLGGFNAHALHHLLPDICHIHYPRIAAIFRDTCKAHGLTYMEMGYDRALASHFRFLRGMGRYPDPPRRHA